MFAISVLIRELRYIQSHIITRQFPIFSLCSSGKKAGPDFCLMRCCGLPRFLCSFESKLLRAGRRTNFKISSLKTLPLQLIIRTPREEGTPDKHSRPLSLVLYRGQRFVGPFRTNGFLKSRYSQHEFRPFSEPPKDLL